MASTMMLMGCGKSAPASGSAGSFNPGDYGTVLAWWDFTQAAKVRNSSGAQAANNESIQYLDDAGPSARNGTQSTSGSRPVLHTNSVNGLQVATFDGGDGFTIGTAAAGAITKNRTGLTFAMAYKPTDFTNLSKLVCLGDNAGSIRFAANSMGGGTTDTGFYSQLKPQDGGSEYQGYASVSYKLQQNAWTVVVVRADFSGNATKMWHDHDVTLTSSDIYSSGNSSNTDPLYDPDSTSLFWPGWGTYGVVGDVGEAFILDGAISDTPVENFITALHTKYAI